MALRMTGLSSGMDTETVVAELMKAKSMQKTKVENKKTKLEWTQDKWKDLNTKLYSLYTEKVSKMRFTGSYNTKKVSVSDSSIASITGNANAINGKYSLQVNNIATANYVTSAKLKLEGGVEGDKVKGSTKISELAGGNDLIGKEITISYKDKTTVMKIDENTTVSSYVNQLKGVGLSASYDEVQQRLFISSGTSGADSNFTMTVAGSSETTAKDSLRNIVADYDSLELEEKDKVDAYIAQLKNNAEGSAKYTEALDGLKAYAAGNATNDEVEAAATAYKQSISSADGAASLAALGLTAIDKGVAVGTKPEGMAVITGTDSEIVLNGATLTGSDTTVNVNGLSIELKGMTNGSTVSFSVSNDVDAVYDQVKSFISEYNAILDEMNTLYHAKSARGYEPLTDEEKEAMTDEQVELWEDKIKDSLLRRDTTLGSLIDSMKSAMMSTVEVDGKTYALSSLGIMTSKDYKEYGKLHIYGDEDDTTYADQADKLKKMLEEDPELATKIMTGITDKLYETMQKKMGTSSISSALTFYNDKQMEKDIKSYESSISKWEEKLKDIEDKYYKQFTAMEKAMAQLQASQSNFAAMLGQG